MGLAAGSFAVPRGAQNDEALRGGFTGRASFKRSVGKRLSRSSPAIRDGLRSGNKRMGGALPIAADHPISPLRRFHLCSRECGVVCWNPMIAILTIKVTRLWLGEMVSGEMVSIRLSLWHGLSQFQ